MDIMRKTLMNKIVKEEGYSLLELTMAMIIMGLMIGIGIPVVWNNSLITSLKTGLKSDVTAVAITVAYIYDNAAPTLQQFETLKREVLNDYVADAEKELENSEYFNTIMYYTDSDLNYCVEASKTQSGKQYVISYYTSTNQTYEQGCVDVISGFVE
jgi:type II secretory pathway pseudopilin PulG